MRFEIKQILFGVFFLALSCLNVAGQEQKPTQEIPTIAFCDLVKNASLYAGKVVRLKASYYVQFEASALSDSSCDQIAWVEFDREIEKSTEPKLWKQFNNWLGEGITEKKNCRIYTRRKVLVTWIGVFEEALPLVKTEEETIVQKFGHMNAYDFQFTAQKVEAVSNLESTDIKVCR